MSKKHILEEGQVYAIPLDDGSYTVGQLVNHHSLDKKLSVDTYAFFNYKFFNREELISYIDSLAFDNPYSVITSSGAPWQYNWELVHNKEVKINKKIILSGLDSEGYINGTSTNPRVLLKAYFGLFPWDGYFKDNYLNEFMLPNAEMRDDVKYLKDFTTDELKSLLPPNSPKLIQQLEKRQKLNNCS